MITLYGTPNSRSTRAAWALEEARADYEFIKIDLRNGEGRTPEYLSVNPGGKVPALVEDGFVLTESAAIVTYIGDRYPDSQLTPPTGTQERGLYGQWCFFAMTELEQPLWTMAKHQFALPEDWRVPAVIDTAKKEFAVALKIFETGLGEKPFILGDIFSGADILLALTLGWASKAGVLPLDCSARYYMERCLARPALAQARTREI
jgi:glutathione S-transferase